MSSARRLRTAAFLGGSVSGFEATAAFITFPEIRDTIGNGDGAAASWVLTIAGIVGAAVVLQAGRLADRFGHHRLYTFGVAAFAASSLLAAAAPTLLVLILGRGLQAIALAIMGPATIAIIVDSTPPERHSRALGFWGTCTAIAGFIAPPITGLLVDIGSWRLPFVVIAAIATLVAIAAFPGAMDATPSPTDRSPDVLGAVVIMTGLGLLVLGLVEGNDWGWLSGRTIGCLFSAAVLILLAVQRSRHQEDPVIPLRLFSQHNVALGTVVGLVASIIFFAHWLIMLSVLTDLWDVSLFKASLFLAIMPLTMAFLASGAGRLIDHLSFRQVMVPGALLYSVLFLPAAIGLGSEANYLILIPSLIGAGTGMALVWPPITGATTTGLPTERLATATALIQTFQRVGGSLGSAIAVAWIAAGVEGQVSTYRNPIWLLIIGGLITALGATGFREST